MSTIHFHQTTTSTPEQFVAGLTDFGPGRSEVFKNSADSYLEVHHTGRMMPTSPRARGYWHWNAARGLRRFPGDMLGRLPFQFVDQPCPGIVEAQRDVSPIVSDFPLTNQRTLL